MVDSIWVVIVDDYFIFCLGLCVDFDVSVDVVGEVVDVLLVIVVIGEM